MFDFIFKSFGSIKDFFINQYAKNLLEHGLTVVGGYLVLNGVLTEEQAVEWVQYTVGAGVFGLGLLLSLVDRMRSVSDAKEVKELRYLNSSLRSTLNNQATAKCDNVSEQGRIPVQNKRRR